MLLLTKIEFKKFKNYLFFHISPIFSSKNNILQFKQNQSVIVEVSKNFSSKKQNNVDTKFKLFSHLNIIIDN